MKKRNYQKTEADVVVVIAPPIVVDISKTTVATVTADQAVIGLEFYAWLHKSSLRFNYLLPLYFIRPPKPLGKVETEAKHVVSLFPNFAGDLRSWPP